MKYCIFAKKKPTMSIAEELRSRIIEADKEVLEGKTRPIEDFFEEVERKYP